RGVVVMSDGNAPANHHFELSKAAESEARLKLAQSKDAAQRAAGGTQLSGLSSERYDRAPVLAKEAKRSAQPQTAQKQNENGKPQTSFAPDGRNLTQAGGAGASVWKKLDQSAARPYGTSTGKPVSRSDPIAADDYSVSRRSGSMVGGGDRGGPAA